MTILVPGPAHYILSLRGVAIARLGLGIRRAVVLPSQLRIRDSTAPPAEVSATNSA